MIESHEEVHKLFYKLNHLHLSFYEISWKQNQQLNPSLFVSALLNGLGKELKNLG